MGELLPWIGMALQWARAQKKFAELYYLGIVLACASAAALMANPELYHEPLGAILAAIKDQVVPILAATQATSSVSNVVQSMAVRNSLVPVTNSQS